MEVKERRFSQVDYDLASRLHPNSISGSALFPPATAVGGFAMAFAESWRLTLIVLSFSPLLVLASSLISDFSSRLLKKEQVRSLSWWSIEMMVENTCFWLSNTIFTYVYSFLLSRCRQKEAHGKQIGDLVFLLLTLTEFLC